MRKSRFGVAAVSVLALCTVGVPAYASTFVASAPDGDESKFFFDKKSLSDGTDAASFFGSTPKNTTAEDVDVTTVGTISDLGNGFGTVKGTDAKGDFLTSLTFTPTAGTTFDGMFFRGQLGVEPKATFDGTINVSVTGTDGITTPLTFTGIGLSDDFGFLGFEAKNDTDLVKSVTISTNSGTFFEEFKQVAFSGVPGGVGTQGGGGGIPEPATWIVMIAGFGLLGALLRRRARTHEMVASLD